jgi:hypothetical protein
MGKTIENLKNYEARTGKKKKQERMGRGKINETPKG